MRPYYQDDAVTIYHGDTLEILPELEAVDHVICDPPYDAKTHNGARYGFVETSSKIPFAPLDIPRYLPVILAAAREWVVCFCSLEMLGGYRDAAGESWTRSGFWRRVNGVPQFTGDRPGQPGEGIAIMHAGTVPKRWNGHGRHGYWEHPKTAGGQHPTTKPLGLMCDLVCDFTQPGQTIVDPFMGSGTTLRAAKNHGRKAIGIECEEKYCNIAAQRMAQEVLDL